MLYGLAVAWKKAYEHCNYFLTTIVRREFQMTTENIGKLKQVIGPEKVKTDETALQELRRNYPKFGYFQTAEELL